MRFKTIEEIKKEIKSNVGNIAEAVVSGTGTSNDVGYIVYSHEAEEKIDRILRHEGYCVSSDFYDSVLYKKSCQPNGRFILYRY